jgi:hypothetical protein
VADNDSGIQVIDISVPSAPMRIGAYQTPGKARGLAISGDYLLVASFSDGLQILDISDPMNPVPAYSYDTPGDAFGVFVSNGLAYVAEHYSLMILRLPQPVTIGDEQPPSFDFSLSQNYPNPFNPATTITYSLAEQAPVTVEIFNLLGQRVRTLVLGTKPAGTYQIEWPGTNDAGDVVATGVYFYRVTAGAWTKTRKMLLLR